MKKITAYKCDYCKKILGSYSGMKNHENKCFHNPQTKSCITCKDLSLVPMINGKERTEKETDILNYKIEGTYTIDWDRDPEGNGEEFAVLNKEYEYLYNTQFENYCSSNGALLNKLKTRCGYWSTKEI